MDTNKQEKEPLTYEETPIIEPIHEPESTDVSFGKPKTSVPSIVTALIFFILLFALGIWFFGPIRTFITTSMQKTSKPSEQTTPMPTPSVSSKIGTQAAMVKTSDAFSQWPQYRVLHSRTRVPYEGVSFKLPPEVLPLICDGSACPSQGTYLPGGTRFTVALRGEGEVLPDYRGKIISDLKGITFAESQTSVAGQTATEFIGNFTGTTVGGYVFTQMRGVMIPVTDIYALEVNHFSPKGITADFEKDDLLFNEILKTLVLPMGGLEKGGIVVSPTPTNALIGSPSATPTISQ